MTNEEHIKKISDTVQNVEEAFVVVQQNMLGLQKSMFGMQQTMLAMQKTMATKDDIVQIRSEMATKEDLKGFATKDDLQNFATKDDFAAIREDLEFIKDSMVTKEDLQETESRLMTHVDGLTMRTEKFDHELVAAQAKFDRIEERVEVLELKAGVAVTV